MSGPKGVEYQIAQERRRLEEARDRFRGLIARHEHLRRRAAAHGAVADNVAVPKATGQTSDAVNAACNEFEAALRTAENRLENQLSATMARAVDLDLDADIARLLAEDEKLRRTAQKSAATPPAAESTSVRTAPSRTVFDAGAHQRAVAQRLADAKTLTPDVEAIAKSALTASTVEEARMALSGLSSAIAHAEREAHRTAERARAGRASLGALRTEVGALLDPTVLTARLDAAERRLDDGLDIDGALTGITAAVRAQSESEAAERDRRIVLGSVKSVLAGLGYTTVDVAVADAGSVVQGPASTKHAVHVDVVDGEITMRTVLTPGSSSTPAENLAADVTLCSDLERVLDGLAQDGIGHGRVRRVKAGLVQPVELAVPGQHQTPATQTTSRPTTTARPTTTTPNRRKQREGGAGR